LELASTLQRLNDALPHPESFGIVQLPRSPKRRPVFARRSNAEVVSVGILPLLLEAKAHIRDRIEDLRPVSVPDIGIDSIVTALDQRIDAGIHAYA
jgi:hypothetical protein